ncbi:MAG: hypothetical protein ACE366_06765 [Bradymonadia bacterium]
MALVAIALAGQACDDGGAVDEVVVDASTPDASSRCSDDRFVNVERPPILPDGLTEALRLCPEAPVDVFLLEGDRDDQLTITLNAAGGTIRSGDAEAGAGEPLSVVFDQDGASQPLEITGDVAAEGLRYSLTVVRTLAEDRCLPDEWGGNTPIVLAPGYRGRLSMCGEERDVFTVAGLDTDVITVAVSHVRGDPMRITLSADGEAVPEARTLAAGDSATLVAETAAGEQATLELSAPGGEVLEYELAVGSEPRPVAEIEWRITGQVSLIDRDVTLEGLDDPEPWAVEGVAVDAVDDETGEVLAEGRTEAEGHFELSWSGVPTQRPVARIVARAEASGVPVRVVAEGLEAPWAVPLSTPSTPAPGVDVQQIDLGEITLDVESPLTPAFHVLATSTQALERTTALRASAADVAMIIRWRPGEAAGCGTCFVPGPQPVIELGGTPRDPDEWDDDIIAHEVGHHVAEVYGIDDSPGGAHDGTPTDPTLAWSEGVAHFHGAWIKGAPQLLDMKANGVSMVDVEIIDDDFAFGTAGGALDGAVSEWLVAAILWDLHDGQSAVDPDDDRVEIGGDRVFQALFERLPDLPGDRGHPGIDLVDHLDALSCGGAVMWGPILEGRDYPYTAETDRCIRQKGIDMLQVISTDHGAYLWSPRGGVLNVDGEPRGWLPAATPYALPEHVQTITLHGLGWRSVISWPDEVVQPLPRIVRGGAVELLSSQRCTGRDPRASRACP